MRSARMYVLACLHGSRLEPIRTGHLSRLPARASPVLSTVGVFSFKAFTGLSTTGGELRVVLIVITTHTRKVKCRTPLEDCTTG